MIQELAEVHDIHEKSFEDDDSDYVYATMLPLVDDIEDEDDDVVVVGGSK